MQIRLLVSLLAAHASAVMLSCENIRVDKQSFNLEKLGGPHSVVSTLREPPSHSNTTYTVDICKPLEKKGDVPSEEQCPSGTRVCGVRRTYNPDESDSILQKVIPIAGDLLDQGGFGFEYEATRLKTSDSNSDVQQEGLRLVLKGGAYPLDGSAAPKKKQRAIIEFLCDPELEGTEGEWSAEEGNGDGGKEGRARDEALLGRDQIVEFREGEKQVGKEGAALKFVSYETEADSGFETLRLEWSTKYACEAFEDEGGSGSWGFFTWLLIILFMLTAAYLIFGSWLNYTRYGARGWDLLPHGDTIRDVPYLMKDWTRSVLNTVQGSGSRGGYSAV